MHTFKRIYTKLYRSIAPDEQFCISCLKNLDETMNLERLFLQEDILCVECKKQLIEHKKIYTIDGIDHHVLYEYDEFLEGLFFRFKEQRDVSLAPLFLHAYRKKLAKSMKSFQVCGLCSSDTKIMQRGFIPLERMFASISVDLFFPFYKKMEYKQSNQSKKGRSFIKDVIFLKESYPCLLKNILLVDDVCTTGSSIQRAISLLKPKCVFLIAAHPLWIEANKENQVEKKAIFW